jgi:hypothetical protein
MRERLGSSSPLPAYSFYNIIIIYIKDTMEDNKEKEEVKEKEDKKEKKPSKSILKKVDSVTRDAMFWFYYSLGDSRTLEKVAEHFNVDIWQLKELSRIEDWQDKIAEIRDTVNKTNNFMLEYIDSIEFGVIEKIIKDDEAKDSDKLKALEKLDEFVRTHSDLIKKKKIVIEFNDRKGLEEIVDKLNKGTLYEGLIER